MSLERLDRVLVPLLLASASAAVLLGVVVIWSPNDSEVVRRLLQTAVVLAIGSGFVLSATRLGGSGVRRDA